MTTKSQPMRILLTGATGLVGRFVLAELLRRRIPTTVIVRGKLHQSAAERIDEALAYFERDCFLPRPVIVDGELTSLSLGLAAEAIAGLRANPIAVVHCAASIRFIADDPSGEPYRSNVAGTRQLLQLCKSLQVASFHHVSTAYTQSQRQFYATANETAVALDAPAGNDYERSKIQAETLVRDCTWIRAKTFLRPSIVVGDSSTGYTPSFHGFYSPLQIGQQIAQTLGSDPTAGSWFREQLGLHELDSKNIVPVNWAASAIVHILLRPELHNQTYHLTNPQAVSAIDIQRAIIDSLHEKFAKNAERSTPPDLRLPADLGNFREQMRTYESYFGNDPKFDRTNAERALRELPCPLVDYAMLLKLSRFALEANFGWPKPIPPVNPLDGLLPETYLSDFAHPRAAVEQSCVIELTGTGATSPLYFEKVDGKWLLAENTVPASNPTFMVTSAEVFAGCLTGKLDPSSCVEGGHWMIRSPNPQNWLATIRQLVHDVRLSAVSGMALATGAQRNR